MASPTPNKMYFCPMLTSRAQYQGLQVVLQSTVPEGQQFSSGDSVYIGYQLTEADIKLIVREIQLHPERLANPDRRAEVWPLTHGSTAPYPPWD